MNSLFTSFTTLLLASCFSIAPLNAASTIPDYTFHATPASLEHATPLSGYIRAANFGYENGSELPILARNVPLPRVRNALPVPENALPLATTALPLAASIIAKPTAAALAQVCCQLTVSVCQEGGTMKVYVDKANFCT